MTRKEQQPCKPASCMCNIKTSCGNAETSSPFDTGGIYNHFVIFAILTTLLFLRLGNTSICWNIERVVYEEADNYETLNFCW